MPASLIFPKDEQIHCFGAFLVELFLVRKNILYA